MSHPTCQHGGVMNSDTNITKQLELGFNGQRPTLRRRQQRTRIERATWWFAKMRHAVEAATDWEAKPTPRGQQLWIAATQRQIAA